MRSQELTDFCHRMINQASAGATILDVPAVEVPEERAVRWSFARLKNPESPVDMGLIADPDKFAAPIFGPDEEFHADILIKAPGTGFIIPDLIKQFSDVVSMAAEAHYNADRAAFKEYCMLHISQGILQPHDSFRAPNKHIDASYPGVLRESYPNNDAYTVSSALPTLYYDQPFEIDINRARALGLSSLYNYVSGMLEQQAREENVRDFGAFHLVRHDSFSVHTAQNPLEETPRTFLQVRFFPAVDDTQVTMNNRWLAAALTR